MASGTGPEPDPPGQVVLNPISEKDSFPTPTQTTKAPPLAKGIEESNVEIEEDSIDEEVHQLARKLTSHSQHHGVGLDSLFPSPSTPALDPESPQFNARKWCRAFFETRKEALSGKAPKTTGVAFKNLNVYGYGSATDFQKSVGNIFLGGGSLIRKLFPEKQQRVDILHDVEGLVKSGEMVAVLGPPGSGCSTFLKTMAGETYGFHVSEQAVLNYQGIRPNEMQSVFRGEAIYTAEVDQHFPAFTVGDTLYFAARARCPKHLPKGVSRHEYAQHLSEVTMAMYGISHTKNTRVGDEFLRGVSGGERKRVTIAEASLGNAPLQCWDNSTRGLDSANAIEFCKTLKAQAEIMGCTSFVAIYQAPQAAYDLFDKVILLYEGHQIFFGKSDEARAYFENLGFVCPKQQTTADFLTSMTSSSERVVRPGWEDRVPRTAEEFAKSWKESEQRGRLLEDVDEYIASHPFRGHHYHNFLESRRMDQSSAQRKSSPYTLSYLGQMSLTLWRSFVLLKNDPTLPIAMLTMNVIEALVVASVFYNLPHDTSSFDKRGLLMFFIILLNAFASILEIITMYAKRRVIEKHKRYAFYHPSAEALSSMIADLPYKFANALCVNAVLYFITNLRREPGPFFFFWLISFVTTLCMSMLFRLMASVTKSIAQALAPASIVLLVLILYTGFAIPVQYMRGWIAWARYGNPIFYSLESVMLSEFVGRSFPCSSYIPQGPGYDEVDPFSKSCTAMGSIAGESAVDGERYLSIAYGYSNPHRWRNFGILIVFTIGYMLMHLIATEYIASERSKGEVLVFSRKELAKQRRNQGQAAKNDVESGNSREVYQADVSTDGEVSNVEKQTSVFHWQNVSYDIKIKREPRRILDHVDGWVKPGTLTALMGASGAGKTTLLDVLASRVTMGVVSGDMRVDGKLRDESFQRKTGYVQQQDLHLETSTVREALNFSALLRQPPRYSDAEKLAYVDTVISLLNMEEYSDAVIGIPGEGLNVEQRKRLTIGVELAARPQLLLFLDEPTSGLDSQTSWSVCDLMEKLTKNGQAILCTIHQPSAMLFQRFDRLLLLSKGRTIYFGDVGKDSNIVMDYFTSNGAEPLLDGANPAEYMLHIIGAAPGAETTVNWADKWQNSPEYQAVQKELQRLIESEPTGHLGEDPSSFKEFAASPTQQFLQVTKRVFEQYWRTPGYIYAKALLAIGASLFIGLSFLNGENTQRGLKNQLFGVFIFLFMFPQMVNQIMPIFVTQRTMYEARERPSKAYSWKAFMAANILVEIAWNSTMSVFCFVCWYFPIGLYKNAEWTNQVHSRGITMFLQVWVFFIFGSSFAHMLIAAVENADVGGAIGNLFMILMFAFCGVLAGPDALPRFWIFMYRVNPFTYVVEGFLSTTLANAPMHCHETEYSEFKAPENMTCGQYMEDYMAVAGGVLSDPGSTNCQFCPVSSTNDFLSAINMSFSNRWRDFGFMWVFCIFNIAAAFFLYWLARVPKTAIKAKKE